MRRTKEIIEEVRPLPGEAVIVKAAPSAFWGTPLIAHLNQLKVDTVILAGMATSGCVRATAVDGAANRLKMMVVEECVFDRIEASHALSLFDIDQKYGDVVSLAKTLETIS
jgi:nicotinamidase-related amidase